MTVITRVVKYIRKGDKGEKGPSLRIQNWADCPTNMYFYAGGNGETYKDVVIYNGNYYSCTQTHSKQSGVLPTNSNYWVLGDKIELVATNVLLATYSLIKNLGAEAIEMKDGNGNVVFSAKNGTVTCNTGNFNNVTVSGTLSGVTGSFKTLNCVNASGTVVGRISFGSDGKMWFEGDLYNQGYDSALARGYRFYSADIWCRGGFGARERNVLYVLGSYGYYYTKGTGSSGVYVSFTSATSSGGETYYTLKCYGDSGDYAGFPVDTIIFKITGSTEYRYNLSMADTQRVLCVNANDQFNGLYIYSNGNKVQWNGGEIAEVIKVPTDFMYPTPNSSWLGRGILIGAFRDNNWS